MYVLKQTKRDTFLDIVCKLENQKTNIARRRYPRWREIRFKIKNSDKSLDLNKNPALVQVNVIFDAASIFAILA